MIRKKVRNTCLESCLAASSRPSSDCELLRRFRQQGWKSLRRFNPWASARALNPAGTPRLPAFHRHPPHRPATARLPARSFLNLPLEERRRAAVCVPRQQPFSTELGGRRRKAPCRTATSTQSCVYRRNPQASGGRAPLKR